MKRTRKKIAFDLMKWSNYWYNHSFNNTDEMKELHDLIDELENGS